MRRAILDNLCEAANRVQVGSNIEERAKGDSLEEQCLMEKVALCLVQARILKTIKIQSDKTKSRDTEFKIR